MNKIRHPPERHDKVNTGAIRDEMDHSQQISDLKKYSKRPDYPFVERVIDESFNAGVAMAVGWMMAEFKSLHSVECPPVLDKCLSSLELDSETRKEILSRAGYK